ncbi:putative collagen-binding domain-containing protein [Neobacillus cucumis]|uniref:putative collagen-binding domain-containing protein n=1 Tax=Neobacillus cucumis TaxID=1740721 RepID=UPI0028533C42|nr:putative collagen-binding domain-containing protein [Neobacillus cucumis]MDR4946124.1 putative collagen-binding domain-containing protein [Neobacillus cucumis]
MISEKERDSFRRYSWFEALDQPGAWQMKMLHDFLESRDLSQCIPCQELLIEQNDKMEDIIDEHIQACVEKEGKFACLYFPSGGEETVDLSRLKIDQLQIWWFNPRDGQCYTQENVIITDKAISLEVEKRSVLKLITPTRGSEQDWVCVIENRNNHSTIPGKAKIYGEMPVPPEIEKTFMW